MIEITSNAQREIKRLQQSRQVIDSYLRIEIKEGGCQKWYYCLDFCQENNPEDILENSNGIPVAIESKSYNHLQSLKIDYSEDLMGGGFRFHNPNATATCSCSNSFSD